MGLFGNRSEQAGPGEPGAPSVTANERDPAAKGIGRSENQTDGDAPSSREKAVATIGKSIVFKGELTGNEDLEVNGTVQGDVKLPDNTLTVGQTGLVQATVAAKSVLIIGKVKGDVTATERIEIEASGVVDGDLRAPRLLVQEGAVMNGTVEMTAGASAAATKSAPATPPRPSSATPSSGSPSAPAG